MVRDIRRVVIGLNEAGQSTVVSDGPSALCKDMPGTEMGVSLHWYTDSTPATYDGSDPTQGPWPVAMPLDNGSRFYLLSYPPLSSATTPEARLKLLEGSHPAPEGGVPGMHKTPSIDYIVMISGEITLELEDGEVLLKAGDTLVQTGGNHAWRNYGDVPAVFASIVVPLAPNPA